MLATIGDLVEDVVVHLGGPVNHAADTAARITRRQGGSAANVAAAARRLAAPSRLVAQVGDDPTGRALVAGLAALGVDVGPIRFGGATGTIVVLVDADGERSMLTDRGAAVALDDPDPAWLADVTVLHVPLYSLSAPPLAGTAATVVGWAHDRRIPVSVDVSSTALIDDLGPPAVHRYLDALRPAVVFANEAEAAALGLDAPIASALTVIKRGPRPVVVLDRAGRAEIGVEPIEGVVDTTGAGDAFAAGFLTAGVLTAGPVDERPAFLADPAGATAAGIRSAAAHLTR